MLTGRLLSDFGATFWIPTQLQVPCPCRAFFIAISILYGKITAKFAYVISMQSYYIGFKRIQK